jgi:hypothetical protein
MIIKIKDSLFPVLQLKKKWLTQYKGKMEQRNKRVPKKKRKRQDSV